MTVIRRPLDLDSRQSLARVHEPSRSASDPSLLSLWASAKTDNAVQVRAASPRCRRSEIVRYIPRAVDAVEAWTCGTIRDHKDMEHGLNCRFDSWARRLRYLPTNVETQDPAASTSRRMSLLAASCIGQNDHAAYSTRHPRTLEWYIACR